MHRDTIVLEFVRYDDSHGVPFFGFMAEIVHFQCCVGLYRRARDLSGIGVVRICYGLTPFREDHG